MKKIFSFITALMLLGTLSAVAQTWDFTKGFSDATKALLNADTKNWTVNRQVDGVATGWKNATVQEGIQMANGVAIPELDGINFVKGFAAGNTLLDPTSIRLGGKSQKLTFKGLKNGQTLTVVAKSANATATNRALISYTTELEYTDGPADGICLGNAVAGAPADGLYTLVWTVNTDNPEGVDVTFGTGSASGGIDIQKIIVKGGVDEDKNIAYITGSEDPESDDYYYQMLNGSAGLNFTVYNHNAEDVTAETLYEYNAVVVAPSVAADSKLGQLVQEQLSFMPIVNFNANLFGYKPVENEETTLYALDESNAVLEGVELEDGTFTYFAEAAPAVALPENFVADNVIAIAGENEEAVMIHQHNPSRNSYIYINSEAGESFEGLDFEAWQPIAVNAINVVATTKKQVAAASAPVISPVFGDGVTTVTIASSTAGAKVFYQYEGDEAFVPYTEAITLTEEKTIIAYAEAEGYLQSKEAKSTIIVKSQMPKPVISAESTTEKVTVTIEAAEGAKIYFNFSGSAKAEESALYTEPVEISAVPSTTVYAFATSETMLDSEMASEEVRLEVTEQSAASVRLDEIAHLDFNETDCFTNVDRDYLTTTYGASGGSNAFYYWGKKAWNYYKLDADGNLINEGTEEEPVYIPNPESVRTIAFGTDWIMKSAGQLATLEYIASAGGLANGRTGRYADSIEDLVAGEPSKGLIDFGGKSSGEPYSMSFETTAKYAGPFDIVTYLGNGGTSDLGIEAQVSTDGVNWETVGALNYTTSQRYWKRTKLSYEGTDEVYVRVIQVSGGSKGQLYDIILLNNGEKSKEYTPIVETPAEEAVVKAANRVVVKNNKLYIETVDGAIINLAGQTVE